MARIDIIDHDDQAGLMTNSVAQTLDGDTECFLAWAARAGDRGAREELVRFGMPWVYMHAARLGHFGSRRDEAVAAGLEGLVRAVDRFDPRKGARLVTFAWSWIARAMQTEALATVPLDPQMPAPAQENDLAVDASILALLPEDYAEILRLRCGFVDGESWSRRAIATRLQITESQVRTSEAKAIVVLQEALGRVSQRAPFRESVPRSSIGRAFDC